MTKELVLGKPAASWVAQTLEKCSKSDGDKEFIRTSNLGSNAFLAQRSSNVYGRCLTVAEYKDGASAGKTKAKEYREAKTLKQHMRKDTCGGVTSKTNKEVVSCSAPITN